MNSIFLTFDHSAEFSSILEFTNYMLSALLSDKSVCPCVCQSLLVSERMCHIRDSNCDENWTTHGDIISSSVTQLERSSRGDCIGLWTAEHHSVSHPNTKSCLWGCLEWRHQHVHSVSTTDASSSSSEAKTTTHSRTYESKRGTYRWKSEQLLTCELQWAAQRALSWSQQRQAHVFGLGVLQTLHQGDGRVLDKLHQQLEGKSTDRDRCQDQTQVSLSAKPEQSGTTEERVTYLWFGVKLIRKHGSPCVKPVT